MINRGSSVHGWPSGARKLIILNIGLSNTKIALDCEEAIEFAKVQDVNCMIEKFPLDRAQEAVDHMKSGKVRFRAVLVMD